MSPNAPAAVVVLAAGEGTRMRSSTPKVLHEIGDRSLLGHVLAAAAALSPRHVVVVVGAGRDAVTAHLREIAPDAVAAVQEQQLGTGHAVRAALAALPDLHGPVVVASGDAPLVEPGTLQALLDQHAEQGCAATVLTARLADPTGYGRVLRDESGAVSAVVEERDADVEQSAVEEVNSGTYAFDADHLRDALGRLTTQNAQGEEYLTDVLAVLRGRGHRVGAVIAPGAEEVLGVNDRVQLAAAGAVLRDRVLRHWMLAGVTVVDPASTWVGADVTLEPDVTLLPGTRLHGRTSLARGAVVGPDTTLVDTSVGERARVRVTTAESAVIGAAASVGPYAFLRPGTRLGEGGKIGTYVETKNADIGPGAKIPHLSYVGDATIGEHTNIGAATVTVNYDGVAKHRTTIGRHARTGADNMFVAPVTVGDGAYTAAGSVIVDDVPAGAMAVARSRQRNVEGWVGRRRAGTASAEAAQHAAPGGSAPSTHGDAAREPGSAAEEHA